LQKDPVISRKAITVVILAGIILGVGAGGAYWLAQQPALFQPGIEASSIPDEIAAPPDNTPWILSTPGVGIGDLPLSAIATANSIEQKSRPDIGNPAPGFKLPNIDGETVDLDDFKGKPVILNFWATWCPPCRFEMPLLQSAYERYQDQELVVLGINNLFLDELPKVEQFVTEHRLEFPILLDETGEIHDPLYRVQNLPTTFFVDRQGTIRWIQIGELNQEVLEQQISSILDPD